MIRPTWHGLERFAHGGRGGACICRDKRVNLSGGGLVVPLIQHSDANKDTPRRVGCIRARVGRRRVDPWLLAWHLLLASCGVRSRCVPISRGDLRRAQIPNGRGKAPIDPVVWLVSPFKMRHTKPRTDGWTDLSVLRGIDESTGSELSNIA